MSLRLRLLLAGAILTMLAAGCSSTEPPSTPPATKQVANANQPMPSPQVMERNEIEGINKNPKLDASDKASYILQIKKQFAYLNARQPTAKSSAGKSPESKKKTSEAKKSESGT